MVARVVPSTATASMAGLLLMYARKQLDFSFRDLLAAVCFTFQPGLKRESLNAQLQQMWSREDEAVVALSVRTAFDAFLSALALPKGSEVVMTGINIPDMVALVRHHGLVVVPVDLEIPTLQVRLDLLRRAITPRTRLIVAAHLYGARMDMAPVFEAVADRPDIHVVEDCAQAFRGCADYLGDPRSGISLYSFGAIKTATAFGGAMARVRCPTLCQAVRDRLVGYPAQGRWQFFKRAVKYAVLKAVTLPLPYGILVRLCNLTGNSHDEWLIAAVRNFKGGDLPARIRQQPALPQLALLRRRLGQVRNGYLDARIAAGDFVSTRLREVLEIPGAGNASNTYWLFPVCSAEKDKIVTVLRERGFDATCSSTQLRAIRSEQEIAGPPSQCMACIDSTVYLPVYGQMPQRELERLVAALKEVCPTGAAASRPRAELNEQAVEFGEAVR